MIKFTINKMIISILMCLIICIILFLIVLKCKLILQVNSASKNFTPIKTNSVTKSDSIDNLKKNPQFKRHGFIATEFNGIVKISKADAIKIAKQEEGFYAKCAKNVTATLVNITDTETRGKLANSHVILKNYPVWIVTYYGVNIITSEFPTISKVHKSIQNHNISYKDYNVVIDSNTGNELETFAYHSYLNK